MDVASGRGNPVNKGLMALNAILVRVDQLLQPLPTARGAIEVDDLKPVRPCVNQRLPTLRIERDALDVAAATSLSRRSCSCAAFHPASTFSVLIGPLPPALPCYVLNVGGPET